MGSKMKTLVIPVCIAILVILIIAILPTKIIGGDLACDDLTKCKGGASCSGPGTDTNCKIRCSAGPVIDCGFATVPQT